MSIAVPELDTIDFEALLEEARGRIPRYAPEWTDHNLHDPGVTLLELLTWITDQQIYQVGFVGDAHHRAFAKLLGVTPHPARPASGLLWPNSPFPLEFDVARGTRVTAAEDPKVHYLVDVDCRLSRAQPERLIGASDRGRVSLLNTDRRERASFPASQTSEGGVARLMLRFDRPILTQGSTGSAGVVSLGVEIENPELQHGDDLDDVPSWGQLMIEYRVEGATWRPLRIVRDDTAALLRSGIVALEIPAISAAAPSELRLRLDRGFFPSAPRISRLALNVLPVVQLEHRAAALLQPSTGLPDQIRELPLRGVTKPNEISPPLRIEVAGPDGWELWEATESLCDLGPEDRRVLIDAEKGVVRFGNGINGKIPPFGTQIRHSIYALTLGAAGRVRAGLSWRVQGQQAQVWTNPTALDGGEDAWDTRRIGLEAQRRVRRPALDLDDAAIRAKLLSQSGFAIARAEILSQHHPAIPDERLPGHRTIVVVPELMRQRDLLETEAHRYLGELSSRLARTRLAGERLHVVLAEIVQVQVRVRLLIEPGAPADEIRGEAQAVLAALLSPLPPSDESGEPSWPVGRSVSAALLSARLARLRQVVAVTNIELAKNDGAFSSDDIALSATALPRGLGHVVEVDRDRGGNNGAS